MRDNKNDIVVPIWLATIVIIAVCIVAGITTAEHACPGVTP